ncbi:hypothetical protein R1sor_009894 [Riccia sorocarpa]|uniref:Nematode resistance protein-like HSPRO2 n=1 Tax=Riccia sorocarpa TaxID=122646 RepID=A0ABD3HWJ1_9MARC
MGGELSGVVIMSSFTPVFLSTLGKVKVFHWVKEMDCFGTRMGVETGEVRIGGVLMPGIFRGTAMQLHLVNCDVDELVQQSSEACEAYARYLHLPELSHLQKLQLWTGWDNEALVRPALHSLEMIFRLISSTLFDTRDYVDKEEWLRRLEALVNTQVELISHISEGDHSAPTTKQQASSSSATSSGPGWQKFGSRSTSLRCSQESLLPRMATWKKAQSIVTRLHFAIEGHMLRVPWTLGLGEPNLSGKPVLEYDKICTPLEVYANRQSSAEYSEDHALATAHQILEAWLVVAQGLVKCIEERISAGDSEAAAKKCWILERVWKLCTSTMDLLQVMDPDDFMRLKQELATQTKVGSKMVTSGAAYCLRSSMMRTVTKACKELRRFVPQIVGVEADPKGGPRLQEAVMELFNSHGQRTRGRMDQSHSYHTGSIHLLQAFQAVEAAIRQFFFTYQQLVIIVMGSGDYKGAIQLENSGIDALQQLYSEPPYFPSVDGARTFLGDFWHQHNIMEERLSMRQAAARNNDKSSSLCSTTSSSSTNSDEDLACATRAAAASIPPAGIKESDYQRTQRLMFEEHIRTTV